MRLRPSIAATLACGATLLFVGCSQKEMLRRMAPTDADARARACLAQLSRGQVDSMDVRLVTSIAGPEARAQLIAVAELLRGTRFDSLEIVGAQVNTNPDARHVNLTYEFLGRSGWVLANVATVDSANSWFIEGFGARPMTQSIEEQASAAPAVPASKRRLYYGWVLMAACAALFSLGTAVWTATRRGMPRRWWWAFLATLGLGAYQLNASTGEVVMQLLNIQFLSASAMRVEFGPWMVSFSLPLGAVAALLHVRRWRRAAMDRAAAAPYEEASAERRGADTPDAPGESGSAPL
jgi:hypothetical protein